MTIDQFWNIVDRVHAASPLNMEVKCTLLAQELQKLPPDEVKSFAEHFGDCFYRAYTYDVWGAAFVICNGCGDDSFMDFRSTLISLGREPFEAALKDADSLAQFDINRDLARYEGYQYVPGKVYSQIGGIEPPCDCPECQPNPPSGRKVHPQEAAGVPLIEWEMSSRFPKLAAKYEFKDSDWIPVKLRREKAALKARVSAMTADLLLKARIIPACGLIPPLGVVQEAVSSGRSPRSTGTDITWEPYALDEDHYWSTVVLLEGMLPGAKACRSDLQNVPLKQDLESSGVANFDDWMESLRTRGLA